VFLLTREVFLLTLSLLMIQLPVAAVLLGATERSLLAAEGTPGAGATGWLVLATWALWTRGVWCYSYDLVAAAREFTAARRSMKSCAPKH
jgi:hypothetical protein